MTGLVRHESKSARDWPAAAIVGAALGVFVICCLVGPGGLLTSWHAADVSYYGQLGERLRAGEIPYRTLFVEYPPGALPVFALPEVSPAHYFESFKILMAVLGGAAIVATAAAAISLRMSGWRLVLALAPLAASPILLGSVVLNRFDIWPMLLTIVALAALLRSRPVSGSVSLALAVVAKAFAVVTIPVVAVYLIRTAPGVVRRAAAAFALTVAVALVPFAVLGPGGLAYSFYVQVTRHTEIESLGASFLLAADRLGLYHARIVDGSLGSRDLAGTFPTALGLAASVVELAAVVLVVVWFAKGPAGRGRFVIAFAAALVAFVAFGKVLSPQYLVWLLPVVPLVRGRRGIVATALLVASLILTRLEFSAWDNIATNRSGVWLLLARNVTLLALFVILAAGVRRSSDGSDATDDVAFRACAESSP
jgi:hypothetical protein